MIKNFDIQPNSKLEIIDENAFSKTSIVSLYIPPHIKKIDEKAFNDCDQLQIIEFGKKIKIINLEKLFIYCNENILIMIPLL